VRRADRGPPAADAGGARGNATAAEFLGFVLAPRRHPQRRGDLREQELAHLHATVLFHLLADLQHVLRIQILGVDPPRQVS
jgi:hypothetical protein